MGIRVGMRGKKNLWTTSWSTFGLLLDHFWSTPSESCFDDSSLVFRTVHQQQEAPWEPSLPITNYCIVQLLVMQSVLILSPCKPLLCNDNK